MKTLSQAVLGIVLLSSCANGFENSEDLTKIIKKQIQANVVQVFGTTFSADQDWSSTTKHEISITADAPLADIAKVQILTEAPYFNENAFVLNEAEASQGSTVTLTYDCPAAYTELVAACVSSEGVYYIAPFHAGDQRVSFSTVTRATRAAAESMDLPDPSGLKLPYSNSFRSYNAVRAQKAGLSGENDNILPWKDSQWENEHLWMLDNAGGNSTWSVAKSTVFRSASITPAEVNGLETIFQALGGKKANEGRKVNLKIIRESSVYQLTHNYLISNGREPITVTPVLMFSTDMPNMTLYYYYFDPADVEGMTEEEEVQYVKSLPKFKCVDCKMTKDASNVNKNEFFKVHEYVLPYYGKVTSSETSDVTAQGFIFPEGTRVGFMVRKTAADWTDSFTADNTYQRGSDYSKKSYEKTNNGEVYADGRLNVQINQYPSFSTAVEYGMKLDDPRAAIFGANQKAYLMFEDGTDVNFVDVVFELQGGLNEVDAAQEINHHVYTFCFEDRILGDYDMNDVVVKAERLNISQVRYTLVACGANDELYLRNINGQVLNGNTEIHTLFGASNGQFVNTNSHNFEPVSEIITVEPSFSFTDFAKQVYIYNKTQDHEVKMAQKGEDPHGIMIPSDFAYPKEHVCIKTAYSEFNNWGTNPVTSTDWYTKPVSSEVFK